MDDSHIINLFWLRSESAIFETSKKYGGYCQSIAYRILRNKSDAEEVVNDVYLKVWDTVPPERPSILQAFLGKIARNLSFNRYKLLRTQKRGGGEMAVLLSELGDCLPSADGVEAAFEGGLTADAINNWLLSTDLSARLVFVRRYYYADSVRDIAERYGMGEGNVKSILHRSRKGLREFLEKEGVTV
jgi:RNA polymerase sigma-70 factor (ECF subfamily)